MKRYSDTGNSPLPKQLLRSVSDTDVDSSTPPSSPPSSAASSSSFSSDTFSQAAAKLRELAGNVSNGDTDNSVEDLRRYFPKQSLEDLVEAKGLELTASTILANEDLTKEVLSQYYKSIHEKFKESLKSSVLSSKLKNLDRNYLLSLNPLDLVKEFQASADELFEFIARGCLGLKDLASVFESQHLLNLLSFLYGTIAKTVNHTASGYCLLMATAAKDGGLREDSMKLFPCFVHPRTVQKHTKVMAKGWNANLIDSLKKEKDHFEMISKARDFLDTVIKFDPDNEVARNIAERELEELVDTVPPQIHGTFDNLNLTKRSRYQRDEHSSSTYDYVASILVKDRVNSNHMLHNEGQALKSAEELHINDFIPLSKEKDYIYRAMVHKFTHDLLKRHPKLFASISSGIKEYCEHQFFEQMTKKSEKFSGNLYMLSESKTEELLLILEDMQKFVHKYEDASGNVHCYSKKVFSGDQKTEKNSTYAILR